MEVPARAPLRAAPFLYHPALGAVGASDGALQGLGKQVTNRYTTPLLRTIEDNPPYLTYYDHLLSSTTPPNHRHGPRSCVSCLLVTSLPQRQRRAIKSRRAVPS